MPDFVGAMLLGSVSLQQPELCKGQLMCRALELTTSPSAKCYCSSASRRAAKRHAVVCVPYGTADLQSGAVPSIVAALHFGAGVNQVSWPPLQQQHHQLAAVLLRLCLAPGLCSWQPLLPPMQATEFQESRHSKPVDSHDVMASDLLMGGGRGSDLFNHFMESGDLGGVPCPWQGFHFTAPPWSLESSGAEQVGR